ncbi:MAG: relaxase/mobilization nuclease domain-containing protein [Saprospiraceae bacterium]
MIAKISSGKNFYGVANYNQKKIEQGQGAILYKQKLGKTAPKSLQNAFDSFRTSRVSKPVFHVSLSFSEKDKAKLSNEKMVEITKDYLDKMGYAKQPYIVYRHDDTKHPHVHILTSRVDISSGKKLPHSHEHRKSKKITDDLEVKYDLTISDKQLLTKKEMVGDLQEAMKNGKPEHLKMLNNELSKMGSPTRVRSTGKGIVYYKVKEGSEKRSTKSVKSSLFKDVGLDKKSLETTFSKNRKERLYVKDSVEKVLAKSPKLNAITFARELRKKGIETEFRFSKDAVIGVKYTYQDHHYKGSTLDRSLSFNKIKEQLAFPDIEQLKLRQNLMNTIKSGKPIDMEFKDNRVVFMSTNPALNQQLKKLPQKEAIDLTRQFNSELNRNQREYEKAGIGGQKLIKGMAEDNLDEYLQKRYKYRQKQNERQIKR